MMEKKKKKKKALLFLCTGNTCRSPMAAAYLDKLLNEKKIKNIDVKTAGVMTVDGLLATPEAVQIMDAVGVDLRKHRSRKLTPELIKKAELILGMTPFHVQSALRMSNMSKGKTYLFKEYTGSDAKHAQITDPMGCTLEVYKRVFGEIKSSCNKLVKSEFIMGKKKSTKKETTENKGKSQQS
jgi:protein-tyrosine phosphatase